MGHLGGVFSSYSDVVLGVSVLSFSAVYCRRVKE